MAGGGGRRRPWRVRVRLVPLRRTPPDNWTCILTVDNRTTSTSATPTSTLPIHSRLRRCLADHRALAAPPRVVPRPTISTEPSPPRVRITTSPQGFLGTLTNNHQHGPADPNHTGSAPGGTCFERPGAIRRHESLLSANPKARPVRCRRRAQEKVDTAIHYRRQTNNLWKLRDHGRRALQWSFSHPWSVRANIPTQPHNGFWHNTPG
jgi:hypothetical protein